MFWLFYFYNNTRRIQHKTKYERRWSRSKNPSTTCSRVCVVKPTCLYESLLLQSGVNTAGHNGGKLQGAIGVWQRPFTVQERRPGWRTPGGNRAAAPAQEHWQNEAIDVSVQGHERRLLESSLVRLASERYSTALPGFSRDCGAACLINQEILLSFHPSFYSFVVLYLDLLAISPLILFFTLTVKHFPLFTGMGGDKLRKSYSLLGLTL